MNNNDYEYTQYIKNHQNNVKKAWEAMKQDQECVDLIQKYIPSTTINLDNIDYLIQNHDNSKFSEEEFIPYRKNFYPTSPEEKEENKAAFENAWKHHYTNNMHHWEWWHETGKADEMNIAYVIEMICDWQAMGYQFNNNAKDWYYKNKENIHLGERQRIFTEDLLELYCK